MMRRSLHALFASALAAAAFPAAAAGLESTPAPSPPAFLGMRAVALVGEHIDGTAFRIPQGLHYDAAHDEVFVADTGNGLVGIFDGTGVPKFTFSPGRGLDQPISVATDPEGNIYVLNVGSRVVLVFNYRGEPLGEIHPVDGARAPVVPSGMEIGPDGRLYVLDSAEGRILVLGLDGALSQVIRGSGRGGSRLQAPYDIAFDAASNLYVTDRRGVPVQVYSPSGKYLRGWGKRDLGPEDFAAPSGISVDTYGYVLVADPLRQDVKIFDPNGVYVDRFGGFGGGAGDVAYPTDVAAGRGGRVYVVERVGRRLQVFERIPLSGAPRRAPPRSSLPASPAPSP